MARIHGPGPQWLGSTSAASPETKGLDGRLTIESSEGGGTTVVAEVPIR